MTIGLDGQWLGKFAGTNSGGAMLDLDDCGGHWEGHALALDDDKKLPGVLIGIRTNDKEIKQIVRATQIEALHPGQPFIMDREQLGSDGIQFPNEIELTLELKDDLLRAHYVLSGQTRHFFDIMEPLQNAAFISLLQHHGFPTPLLDWTHSPFVAAFFAYRRGQSRDKSEDKVRILIFDRVAWMSDYSQIQSLAFAGPHFSIIEAFNFENPRAAPQQSISTVSNLDDIETYIAHCEAGRNKSYLQAIDLPFADRRQVMEQLRVMGITAASLFPGLDGACEELRGRFFHPL